jgi:tRNA pseudouridine38-40 synthase
MRYALGLQYDGTQYYGYQSQPGVITIQGCLDRALSRVADERITSVCAGRTDAGVHATGQVVHFDTNAARENHAWLLGVNSNLPDDISVSWVVPVPDDFHARFHAIARRYRYTVYNAPNRMAMEQRYATWHRKPLDAEKMHHAAQYLLGQHDFTAFRSVGCQAKSAVRTVHEVSVKRDGLHVSLDIKANAFLYHMVRNIMGSLFLVGEGEQPVEWLEAVLAGHDRAQAGVKAPPNGLILSEITYQDCDYLPSSL